MMVTRLKQAVHKSTRTCAASYSDANTLKNLSEIHAESPHEPAKRDGVQPLPQESRASLTLSRAWIKRESAKTIWRSEALQGEENRPTCHPGRRKAQISGELGVA